MWQTHHPPFTESTSMRTQHYCVPRVVVLLLLGLVSAGVVPRAALAQPSWPDNVRFLQQATFGPNLQLIDQVQRTGFESFLADQAGQPAWDYPELEFWPAVRPATCVNDCQRTNYTMYPLQTHFFQNALYGPDQLRQKMAWALGQILVISGRDLPLSSWVRQYQQILYLNAFGNYRSLLRQVTLNPAMGNYLDMVNNRCQRRVPNAPDVCYNGQLAKPNENYAREILQLFSIGVFLLNPDGTVVVDPETGAPIPSYTQETVEEFSRVFTGWIFAPQLPAPPESGVATVVNYRDPMVVRIAGGREDYHDKGPKVLLNGFELPGGQTAEEELDAALNNIISHSNVAPFVSKLLIQHLVTSNPSPEYVGRVAAVFAANVDSPLQLFAVAQAILLDPEARGDAPADPNFGHLREPVQFMTSFLRMFNAMSYDRANLSDGVLDSLNLGGAFQIGSAELDQDVFRAPTVFNFYSPEFAVPGEGGVLGPEFGIHSSMMALRRSNFIQRMVFSGIAPGGGVLVARPNGTSIDLSPLLEYASDPPRLVEFLNLFLLGDAMSAEMWTIITNRVAEIPEEQALLRVRSALYLMATSGKYQVER
jgi:uncharacterized protein (DUF1800 family)